MKKRALILGLIGAFSLTSLTSCEEDGTNSTITTIENVNYKIEDNLASKMAYDEFLKSYPNLTYNDFRLNTTMTFSYGEKCFTYNQSTVTLKNNTYYSKSVLMDNKNTYYLVINDEWVKMLEYIIINEKENLIYSINSDGSYSGTFYSLNECIYNDLGNKISETYYDYENNSWILRREYEYTYDKEGNKLTETKIKLENGEFSFKDERTYDKKGNTITIIGSNYENDAWALDYKAEFTYDENDKKLTHKISYFINNEWLFLEEYIFINGSPYIIYDVYLDDDNTFKVKYEYTYDDNGNMLTKVHYKYQDGDWVLVS